MKIAVVFTLVFTLYYAAGRAGAAPKKEYGKIEILRDKWGVPHIFSDTDAGAMYGLGYSTARDRGFQMTYNLRIIQGRLAEAIGDVKVGVDRRRPEGKNSALRNDVKMRTIGFYRTAQKVAKNLDAETLTLLEAYSEGVNDYFSDYPEGRLYLFKGLGIEPEPWTPAACLASWWRMGLFFSGDGLREIRSYYEIKDGRRRVRVVDAARRADVRPGARGDARSSARDETQGGNRGDTLGDVLFRAGPKVDDAASVVKRGDVTDEWVRRLDAYAKKHGLVEKFDMGPLRRPVQGPKFSHAWVVGGKRTTTGAAVLVSDPQTPVRNPSMFVEYHIQGKTFNARGIGAPGSPMFLIGFTRNVAWGLTALGADQADLFVLKTNPDNPNQYEVDGKWLDMEVREETVRVKGGRSKILTVKETRYGPVVSDILTLGEVRCGHEAALKRFPLCDTNRETVQALLGMMRAADVYEFHKALAKWRFPSGNCVFGDRQGNIGYTTVLALPVRSPDALIHGKAAHEGWLSKNDWSGIAPHDLLPHVINPAQGWLVTANHRPIESFYPIPVGITTGAMGDTDRSWRLKERMALKETFAPEDVLDIHYETANPVKRELVRLGYHLRDVLKKPLEEDTLKALEYLEGWHKEGGKSHTSVKGTEIMNVMPMAFRAQFAAAVKYGGGVSGLCNMLKTVSARLEKNPKADLTDEEAEYVDLILRAAWRYGISNFGEDPDKWQEVAKRKLQERKLGYQSTLDGFPSLDAKMDVNLPALQCIEGGTIQCQLAQTYTQYVPLHDADQSLAILPVGPSEHPGSPWRLTEYDRWSKGQLRPAPLSREKIEPHVVSRKTF